jgi:hypothetical protein
MGSCSMLHAVQELFFSGAIPQGTIPPFNNSTQHLGNTDQSGRGTAYTLFRNTPKFLLRNHRTEPELAVPVVQGASSSSFCLVPYGQVGGYGGRFVPAYTVILHAQHVRRSWHRPLGA